MANPASEHQPNSEDEILLPHSIPRIAVSSPASSRVPELNVDQPDRIEGSTTPPGNALFFWSNCGFMSFRFHRLQKFGPFSKQTACPREYQGSVLRSRHAVEYLRGRVSILHRHDESSVPQKLAKFDDQSLRIWSSRLNPWVSQPESWQLDRGGHHRTDIWTVSLRQAC